MVKDINPGVPSVAVRRPDQRQRHALLRGRRRHAWRRAVEVGWDRRRNVDGQGHQSWLRRLRSLRSDRTSTARFTSTANDGTHGDELWKSDGTAAGTMMVKDIGPGSSGSDPQDLTNVNGTLYFDANDGRDGSELWKSDGTAAGTVMVKDIDPGSDSSVPQDLTNVNGTLYFAANDGAHGDELWKSDGTAAGTVMVKDIDPGATGSGPSFDLTNVNGTLYFDGQRRHAWLRAVEVGWDRRRNRDGQGHLPRFRQILAYRSWPLSTARLNSTPSTALAFGSVPVRRDRRRHDRTRHEHSSYDAARRNGDPRRRFQRRQLFRHPVAEHEQRPGLDLGDEREQPWSAAGPSKSQSRAELGLRSEPATSTATAIPTSCGRTRAAAKPRSGK